MKKSFLIKNTTIFDGINTSLIKNVDLFIEDNKISTIGNSRKTNRSTATIDGSKYTVIPGLIDCHTHFREWMPSLFFRFGVTTIRDVGSDPDWIIPLREKEKRGDNSLPRIVCYGPLLDGVPAFWGTEWKGSVEIDSLETARKITSSLIKKGVDGFKSYANLNKKLMREIVKIAQEAGLPVASDLWSVSAWDATAMGITSIEHASGIRFPIPADKISWCIDLLLRKSIYLDPTFIVNEINAYRETVGNEKYPHLSLVPEKDREEWLQWRKDNWFKDLKHSWYKKKQKEEVIKAEFVVAFYKKGGKIVAGSDTPNPFVIPGFSLHQEIQKMVRIGIPSIDALKAATSVAAELLRRKDIGVIKEGYVADIILLKGNPINDISQLDNIQTVMKNGEIVYQAL